MKRDIANWTRTCTDCQQSKIHRHVKAPLQAFPAPDARFDSIHVDIVGPLPPSRGFTHLFSCVDRYTRWPEAIPMTEATAESCARALLSGWVARFGVPTTLTSDQGRQFESNLWKAFTNLLGATRTRTTAYHPQANGLVERFHRHLKEGLKARLTGSNWADELPIVLLGVRSSFKEDLSCTSAELVYGTTLRLPGDFFSPLSSVEDPSSFVERLRRSMQKQRFLPSKWHGSTHSFVPAGLNSASHVFVRRDAHKPPLTRPYTGPFRVLDRGEKHFPLDISGRQVVVSIDRLKPANLEHAVPCQVEPPKEQQVEPAHASNPPTPSTTSTRTGRTARPPARLQDYVCD